MAENALRRIYDIRSGNIGPVDYKIGSKGIRLNGQYGDLSGSGRIDYDGNLNLDLSYPFLGGQIDFNALRRGDDSRYYLQYLKRF